MTLRDLAIPITRQIHANQLYRWIMGVSDAIDNGFSGQTLKPKHILQFEGGTLPAPDDEIFWAVQPTDSSYPSIAMRLFGPTFLTTVNPVFVFGANADAGVAGRPRCVFIIEQDFESAPGVHQLEWYLQSEQTPGVNVTRPFAFVQFLTGPDAGKVATGIQYTESFVLRGGTAGSPTTQWSVIDGQMTLAGPAYTVQAGGGLAVSANGGSLHLEAPAGALVAQCQTTMLLAAEHFQFANAAETASVQIDQNVPFQMYPIADGTGSLGLNTNRWALVRAVTITSGDLHLQDDERGAHWILREEPDCILAINETTKESFRLAMVPNTHPR